MQTHPEHSARAAGLRYMSDAVPGIRRVKAGAGVRYRRPDGRRVKDKAELGRLKSLAIPPAWTGVWISPDPDAHLQATGRDARGRKQYRYHPRWRRVRDETKYDRMIAFGEALPLIRERTDRAMQLPGLPREKVLATVVRLLETTLIRVGNDEYARDNRSFGLTTMQDRHAKISGSKLRFQFRGKSGVMHAIDVDDRRLARIVRRCREVPGQDLFQYVGDDGSRHTIGSSDVNEYLHEITGERFTSKDFRTWAGTVLAAQALAEFTRFDSQAEAKRNVVAAIEKVAKRLGNTKAVCRKCYVHPAVVDAYFDGTLLDMLTRRIEKEIVQSLNTLDPEEAAVLAFLRQRLKRDAEVREQAARLGWGNLDEASAR